MRNESPTAEAAKGAEERRKTKARGCHLVRKASQAARKCSMAGCQLLIASMHLPANHRNNHCIQASAARRFSLPLDDVTPGQTVSWVNAERCILRANRTTMIEKVRSRA